MRWTPETIETLKRLRAEGLTFDQCASVMQTTRGSIASAVWIHVLGNSDKRPKSAKKGQRRRRLRNGKHLRVKDGWNEHALTETWEERKARRARERAST